MTEYVALSKTPEGIVRDIWICPCPIEALRVMKERFVNLCDIKLTEAMRKKDVIYYGEHKDGYVKILKRIVGEIK